MDEFGLLLWGLCAVAALAGVAVLWFRRRARQRLKAKAAEAARLAAAQEQARRAAEAAARQEALRQAEEAARREAERQEAERREAERLAAEVRARAEAQERAEAERRAALEVARLEAQRKAAEESARREAQRRAAQERERAARLQAEREAAEAAARREAERLEAERLAAEASAAAAAAAAAAMPRKPREQTLVMVADDSKIVRVKAGRLLSQHQYQVCYAEDGLDAARQIEVRVPDVLITDVEMPGMDGFQLTAHVRANPRTAHMPVIMITAADDRHREDAARVGVSVLLGKPYPEAELLAQIEATLDASHAAASAGRPTLELMAS